MKGLLGAADCAIFAVDCVVVRCRCGKFEEGDISDVVPSTSMV